jgi:hypothetical protein
VRRVQRARLEGALHEHGARNVCGPRLRQRADEGEEDGTARDRHRARRAPDHAAARVDHEISRGAHSLHLVEVDHARFACPDEPGRGRRERAPRPLHLRDMATGALDALARTESPRRAPEQLAGQVVVAELRHRDAPQGQRGRVLAQRHALERAERITRRSRINPVPAPRPSGPPETRSTVRGDAPTRRLTRAKVLGITLRPMAPTARRPRPTAGFAAGCEGAAPSGASVQGARVSVQRVGRSRLTVTRDAPIASLT